MAIIGGIEMGGTKMVCAVSRNGREILEEVRYPTGADPQAALAQAVAIFHRMADRHGPVSAIGIGAFGPCDPDPASATYGSITTTPKPGWRDADVLGTLRRGLGGMPMRFDTDVNAAALGELRHGAGSGLDSLVYLTIGTGIGGGVVLGGALVHGMTHPEIGHLRVPRPPAEQAAFAGVCPYHGDCLEGVAAGPAIAARWGVAGQDLPADHPAWDLEADYLGEALATLVLVLSPQRIVLGGAVGLLAHLLSRVRPRMLAHLGGYIAHPSLANGATEYIVHPQLGNHAGVIGAFCLVDDYLAD